MKIFDSHAHYNDEKFDLDRVRTLLHSVGILHGFLPHNRQFLLQ
mgnify:CR=1 FL=1